MKVKVQLFQWAHELELNSIREELRAFSAILKLQLLKAENDHYGNIFVVQLPSDDVLACQQINAVLAFCNLKGHSWEFVEDSYPSVPIG
jgi:hypothetical protein